VGVAVGDIAAVAVAAGVAEETAVSAARSTPGENWKASELETTRNGRDRLRGRRFIRTLS
jgi:hypothetical protein